ncbi:MAG: autotransporter outer membrane beta-barrel domain-containing protein, partial [Alphaproteobacteria bacterium]|nr:autotransporter outer membrane beta-barrel domain-containing protein [Alphaproteobacteria bacterium]
LGAIPKLRITQDFLPSSRDLISGSTTEYIDPAIKSRDDGIILINRQEKDGYITRISEVFRVQRQSLGNAKKYFTVLLWSLLILCLENKVVLGSGPGPATNPCPPGYINIPLAGTHGQCVPAPVAPVQSPSLQTPSRLDDEPGYTPDGPPPAGNDFAASAKKLAILLQRFKGFQRQSTPSDRPTIRYMLSEQTNQEPIVIKPKDSNWGFFVAGLFSTGKNEKTDLSPASKDYQEGILTGVEWRDAAQENFINLAIGGTLGESHEQIQPNNIMKGKTALSTLYYSHSFWREGELNTYGTASHTVSNDQRVVPNPTGNSMYSHARPKTDRITVDQQIAYKFKWKDDTSHKTIFSIKPYAGLVWGNTARRAFKDRDGGPNGFSHAPLAYDTVDVNMGLGIRRRWITENWTLKATGEMSISFNLNRPKINDMVFVNSSPETGFLIQDPSPSLKTLTPSLNMSMAPKDGAWKLCLQMVTRLQDHRTSNLVLLRLVVPFGAAALMNPE